jgi:hypothetical protein
MMLTKAHFTWRAQHIWVETHLEWYLGQQMGPYFANGHVSVKPFDPFQGPNVICTCSN